MIKNKKLQKIIAGATLAFTLGMPYGAVSAQSNYNDDVPINADDMKYSGVNLGDDIPIVAEFKGTTLVDTLDALSKLSGIPIVVNGKLDNEVTLNSNGQTFHTILDNLAKAFNLSYVEKDGMVVVSEKDTMTTTETMHIDYADIDDLKKDIETFVDEKNVSVSKNDNSITISGSAADVSRARSVIAKKDKQQKQVSIQAKFIEIDRSDEQHFGLNYTWDNLHNSEDAWNKGWRFAFTSTLTAEGLAGKGKVLARPTVSVMNGKEATINLSEQVPILTTTTSNNDKTTTVEYKDVGVILKVTPRINGDTGDVTMQLSPQVSTITQIVTNENVRAPQIATRQVNTTLRVKSGETVIIGGLLKKDDIKNISKIPFLGDLPLLGGLFRTESSTKSNTELIVMLTPIIEGDELIPEVASVIDKTADMHNMNNKETMEKMETTDRLGRKIEMPKDAPRP